MLQTPSNYISFTLYNPLEIDQLKKLYSTIKEYTPTGTLTTIMIDDDNGMPYPVPLIARSENNKTTYIFPCMRNILDDEIENLIDAVKPYCNSEFHVSTNVSNYVDEPKKPSDISIDSENYYNLEKSWAKKQHDSWLDDMNSNGWRYGTEFNIDNKTHPLMKSWVELPAEYQQKNSNDPKDVLNILDDNGYVIISKKELEIINDILRRANLKENIVIEAPITDFNLIGDFSKNSSYRHEEDRKKLTYPPSVENIKKKWVKCPYDFNLIFVNSPEANKHTEMGLVDREWLQENMPKAFGQMQLFDGKINVIYTNNKGSERVAMTPWIIAHRFAHAVSRPNFNLTGGKQIPEYRDAENILLQNVSFILNNFYLNNPTAIPDMVNYTKINQVKNILKNFYQAIGTFRSARENNLRQQFEMLNELLAQYIITGSIKFNNLPMSFKADRRNYRINNENDYDYYNDVLRDLAEELENTFDMLLSRCVSHIFLM